MTDSGFVVGIDTGGTFTDCVILDKTSGDIVISKSLSTPEDFAIGLFASIERGASQLGLAPAQVLARSVEMVIGTTVGTNAFLERKGALTGLLTTKGFKDTLFIMRGIGRVIGRTAEESLVLESTSKPEPIVPKHLIREVAERVDWEGEILLAPDRDAVLGAASELVEEGVEAIAICFLWSFKESANEASVRDWIRAQYPGLYVSCSHEIAPKLGEFERFTATAINCYVGPKTKGYLERVAEAVRARGYKGKLFVMGCDGGVRSSQVAAGEALITINSGPAGGVTGSAAMARRLELSNVITADVGGTSFDVGLIRTGEVQSGDKTVLGQYEFFVPSIDVQSIGAGGGSIAWIDERRRTLSVGPESAGADPGPVCYGKGGTRPTLTDAALCLGYLAEVSFLGRGGMLDVQAARRALELLGAEIGLSGQETAAGVVQIAEARMSDLVRRMLVSKGHDPRDYCLFAYGGAGPVHAAGISRDLGLSAIVVPAGNTASVWSAFGVGTSDIKHVYEYAAVFGEPLDAEAIRQVYGRLFAAATRRLAEEGIPAATTRFAAQGGLRYRGQLHQVFVTIDDPLELDEITLHRVVFDFEAEYTRVYGQGTALREAGVEFVDFRLSTITPVDRPPVPTVPAGGEVLIKGMRAVRFVGLPGVSRLAEPCDVPVLDGDAVGAGAEIDGPALIELSGTTIVVAPDYRASRHPTGSYVLRQLEDGGPRTPVSLIEELQPAGREGR